MKLEFLGGAQEVGRSCIRVGIGKVSLLLDAGIKTENRVVRFPTPRPVSADAVVVSHCHLDHIGYLPVFFSRNEKKTPYFCTPPTEPLIELLLEDSLRVFSNKGMEPYYSVRDMRMLPRYAHTMAYQRPYEFYDGTSVALFDASHVLGSAQVLLSPPKGGGKPLLYSGDVNPEPSQMHSGAVLPDCEVGTLIVESTYADREHPDRKALERKFCAELEIALREDKSVIVPAFAVGRTQELIRILAENNFRGQVYLDGMGQRTTQLSLEYPSYFRSPRSFVQAVKKIHFVSDEMRRKIGRNSPAVIIATAGMVEGGPALGYMQRLSKSGGYKVFLTGFQVPGTNGRMLLEKKSVRIDGKVRNLDCEVQYFDFSAHAGKSSLFSYVESINPDKVYCVHGDEKVCLGFAAALTEEGFDATAPELGKSYEA